MEPAALDLLIRGARRGDRARRRGDREALAVSPGNRVHRRGGHRGAGARRARHYGFRAGECAGAPRRARALGILDTLTREGEYLPLALAFLSTQFRTALVGARSRAQSAQQIQAHFQRLGVAMWGSRAEQVYQTVSKFNKPRCSARWG